MSFRELVHNPTFIFDGTNYDVWKIRILNLLREMDPNIKRIVDMGFSPPKDSQKLSLEDEENSYLDTLVSNDLICVLSDVVLESIMPFRNAHELWTKLQDKYGKSMTIEDDCSPSTTGRDGLPSSTSPKCGKPQTNVMVSSDRNCIVDGESSIDYTSSPSHCNDLSLDLNSSSTPIVLHARVDSPRISCNSCLTKSHDDMLALSCCHDKNACVPSNPCIINNVEETKLSMEQDVNLSSSLINCSSSSTFLCLMAKSTNNDDDDNNNDNEENDNDAYFHEKGLMVLNALSNNETACANLFEIMSTLVERGLTIKALETSLDEKGRIEREDAHEKASLTITLEEEQEHRVSLEEELESIEESHNEIVANLTKERDHALVEAKDLKRKYNELTKLSSSMANINDACATNSTSCEASTLKENVELRAQLEWLTSKYEFLEESHEKLSSSNEDLLASHARLKLAHEAISTKVTSCEPHVDNGTTSTLNAILPRASPSNSSTHNVSTSCDELLSMPCFSSYDTSTSSSSCVDTNHVEEIKELKAQVTSLKIDLEKCHGGKSTLDNILSVQKSPNDKRGLGFISNHKNKSKFNNKKKGHEQVKNSAKIVCFKCKVEGNHVRSCPLKKKPLSEKQQGKRPQVQSQAQLQVEERPLPKNNQAIVPQVQPQVAKATKKKGGSRCCYLCREKGHLASSCTNDTLSNPIIIDDVYSLRKDKVGNVFAKFVGTQSGVKKRTIWAAKPIVTNLLGPNLVGDKQAKT